MAKSEFDEKIYDRRVVERNVRTGVIERKEYERYLKSLEDDAKDAVPAAAALGSSGSTPRDIDESGD